MAVRAPSRHFRVEPIAPGVYAAIATPTGYGLCNAGIIDLGGTTVVFDAMLTPMAGADLARAAERLTGRRPTWIVNSHWHGDHIWGNSAFAGGHVVSSGRVRTEVLRRSRRQFRDCRRDFPAELDRLDGPDSRVAVADRPRVRGWFRGVLETPRPLRIVPPELTFEDALVLTGTRRSLHLITYGGGHSPSDVFGYLPDERIVLTGDLVMVGLHPSVGDGWPDRWERILARIEGLRPDRIVPGHGPTASGRWIHAERTYLGDLLNVARGAIRRHESLREAVRAPIPTRYRAWGFAFMFPENVARAFRLLGPRTRAGLR